MRDLNPGIIVLASTVAAMVFTNTIKNLHRILLLFDSIGLGFFTVLGIQVGINHELHPVICIALGTITACFGGVIRDISLNSIPLIFQKEVYATACVFGGIVYFVLQRAEVPNFMIEAICITSIVTLRLLAVRYNWKLPAIWTTKY